MMPSTPIPSPPIHASYDNINNNKIHHDETKDPAHVPFTHHGAKSVTQSKVDMDSASPFDMSLERLDVNGMKVRVQRSDEKEVVVEVVLYLILSLHTHTRARGGEERVGIVPIMM